MRGLLYESLPAAAAAFARIMGDAAKVEWYSLRKNGRFVREGDSASGRAIGIGYRSEYYDPSF